MSKTYPREAIAAELSDLRHMRGSIADLQGIALRLLSQASAAEVPPQMVEDMRQALALIDGADKIAQARMIDLYNLPTTKAANDDRSEAA